MGLCLSLELITVFIADDRVHLSKILFAFALPAWADTRIVRIKSKKNTVAIEVISNVTNIFLKIMLVPGVFFGIGNRFFI